MVWIYILLLLRADGSASLALGQGYLLCLTGIGHLYWAGLHIRSVTWWSSASCWLVLVVEQVNHHPMAGRSCPFIVVVCPGGAGSHAWPLVASMILCQSSGIGQLVRLHWWLGPGHACAKDGRLCGACCRVIIHLAGGREWLGVVSSRVCVCVPVKPTRGYYVTTRGCATTT